MALDDYACCSYCEQITHPVLLKRYGGACCDDHREIAELRDDVRRLRNAEADLTAACAVYRERAEAAAYLLVGDEGLPRRLP